MEQKLELREIDIVTSIDFCQKCKPKAYRLLSNLTGFDEKSLRNGGQYIARTAFIVGKQIMDIKATEINTQEKAREIAELGFEKAKEILQPEIKKEEFRRFEKEIEEKMRNKYLHQEQQMNSVIEENQSLKKELRDINKRYLSDVTQINENLAKLTHSPIAMGKAQEYQIASRLKTIASEDSFSTENSVKAGEDIIAKVKNDKKEIGIIIIESKNVKKWSSEFVAQTKRYMQRHGTPYAIIATTILPDDKTNDKMYNINDDGIWIVKLEYLEVAYRAMRDLLIKVSLFETESKRKINDYTKLMNKFKETVNSQEYRSKFAEISQNAEKLRQISDKMRDYSKNHCNALQEIAQILISSIGDLENLNKSSLAKF